MINKDVEHTSIKILFAGGGTGGHLFPALAIADEIRKMEPGAEIMFVGTKKKLEARVVPEHGYPFRTIWISGFHRSARPTNLLFPLRVVVALTQSLFLIRKFGPDVVVGTGGYVAGPVVYAASLAGIATVVHESNSYPGVTTRLLSKRATRVLATFGATKKYLKRADNVELVGNPTRNSLGRISREQGAEYFGLDPTKRTLLVFGGSLGAASINGAMMEIVGDLLHEGLQIIWQTGERSLENVQEVVDPIARSTDGRKAMWIGKFIDHMEYAYAAADLIICRAGATTLAELTLLGKPAILVPYPHAAADHQTVNAKTLASEGAAEILPDAELGDGAKDVILRLMNDDSARLKMGESSKRLGHPDAAQQIARKILELAHR